MLLSALTLVAVLASPMAPLASGPATLRNSQTATITLAQSGLNFDGYHRRLLARCMAKCHADKDTCYGRASTRPANDVKSWLSMCASVTNMCIADCNKTGGRQASPSAPPVQTVQPVQPRRRGQ